MLVHKLAGALAEQRMSLREIKATLESILNKCKNLRTIGVSLSGSVTLPNSEQSNKNSSGNTLQADQIEIGLGIHNERGRHRMKMMKSAELASYLLNEYLFKNKAESSSICLLINNLGGLSNLELYLLVHDCVKHINEQKLGQVSRLKSFIKTL